MLLVFFFTHHRHLMLSHPDLQQLQGFGSYPQQSNAQCPQTDGMHFTLFQGVIVDVLGAGSSTVTRNESLELLGCHWFASVHLQKQTPISITLPTELSIRQIGIKKHPHTAIAEILAGRAEKQFSQLLSGHSGLIFPDMHCLVVRYTMRIKRTPSSSIQSMLEFGSKKA